MKLGRHRNVLFPRGCSFESVPRDGSQPGAWLVALPFVPVTMGGNDDGNRRDEGENPNEEHEQMAGFVGNHDLSHYEV